MRHIHKRGFTLAEILIASTVFIVLVMLVMGAAVFQMKMGIGIGNYADMNESSRKVLYQFEKDMRTATSITAMSDTEVIVSVINDVDWGSLPDTTKAFKTTTVRYFYNNKTLYRQSPAGTAGSAPDKTCTIVLKDLTTCKFAYFNTDDVLQSGNISSAGSVKKILLTGTMQRTYTGTNNTDYLVSAVVVMRSKGGTRI